MKDNKSSSYFDKYKNTNVEEKLKKSNSPSKKKSKTNNIKQGKIQNITHVKPENMNKKRVRGIPRIRIHNKHKIDFESLKNGFYDFDIIEILKKRIEEKSIKDRFYDFDFIELFKNGGFRARALIIAISAIFIAACIILPSSLKAEEKKYIITDNKAEEYFYAGDYTNAIDEYIKIASKYPEAPIWDAKIAEVNSVTGDIVDSEKYIKIAKAFKSKDGYVLNYIVFTEFMNKDLDAARADGTEALKLNKNNKNLIKTMFTVYMSSNQNAEAKDLLTRYPVNTKSSYDIAEYSRMLMLLDDWDNGLKELNTAWKLNPDEFKVYDVLSQIATYNGDLLLQKITDLSTANPKEVSYKMWLAKIYSLHEASAEQSQTLLTSIANENIGNIEVKLIEAAVLQNSNKMDQGDALITQVIKQYPNNYSVLHAAGWYYLNKKDYTNAMKYCKASIVKNKDYTDNYGFLMPEILKAEGKNSEGEPYFRTALLKEPYNYNIMLSLANYYWYTTKDSGKAMEYFQLAATIKPNDPEIKYNMALIMLTNKNDTEAINLLNQCIKLDSSVGKYYRSLGTVYMLRKDYPNAILNIRGAYSDNENDILALNNAGCYYIIVESNLQRGLYNLQKAYEGINNNYDQYTKDTITANYKKAQKLQSDFDNGSDNQVIKIPEFIFLY